MSADLVRLIDDFAGLRVVVIGDAMLDRYLVGTATRLCPEAPAPIVDVTARLDAPGGAGNAAANVAALGAAVTLMSLTGDDSEARALRSALAGAGVDTESLLSVPARQTLTKQRVMAGDHLITRVDEGSKEAAAPADEDALIDRLTDMLVSCDVAIVSDYGYGVLTPRVIAALAAMRSRSTVLVVDTKEPARFRGAYPTATKPNYSQAIRLLGLTEQRGGRARAQQIAAESERLLDVTGARLAAVTLDADGAVLVERDAPPYQTYAPPVARAHVAGAGDTYVSALALALAAGATTPVAAELAAAAAAVVTRTAGTGVCSATALLAQVAGEGKVLSGIGELAVRAAAYRRQGRRIVFTNGCFDIIHHGHVTYLNRAKALGDVLIVGLNSDASVRRLKGPGRPINPLADRAGVLSALSCVDHIVRFDEDTPAALIRSLRPDLFVKGGDYSRDRLPEAALVEELGGAVQILPFLDDRSTTATIRRIREERPIATMTAGPADGHAQAGWEVEA